MKIEILRENLNSGLTTASRFISSRPQLPILANVLIVTDEGKVKLSATNLEMGVNLWLGAKVEEEGKICLPAKEITEFISYLSAEKLTLETQKESQLIVFSPQARASFVGMASEEFPEIPHLNEDESFILLLPELVLAVSQVSFAAAVDETRPVLAGIYWQFNTDGYQMVATDGYRLSVKKVILEQKPKIKKSEKEEKVVFLVPAKTLNEVVRLGRGESVKIGLTKEGNQAIFGFPQLEISSRLLEGDFPEYERIIPTQKKTSVLVDKNDFSSAIKAASVFARQSANIVILSIDKKEMEITADAPHVGENKTTLPIKAEGEPIKVAFNFRFLLDFINAVPSGQEELLLELTEPLSPVVFKIYGDESWIHVIMPVRLEK